MLPKSQVYLKKGERGTPYSMGEARLAIEELERGGLDQYFLEILTWLYYEAQKSQRTKK